jgi:uncharacterized protein with HEPN domain
MKSFLKQSTYMVIKDLPRVQHMLESIEALLSYIKRRRVHEMSKNRMLTSAIERELEILGEAANHISEKAKSKAPEIPWKQIIGMRHHISHEYFDVDYRILWKTIKHELPALHKQLKKLLASLEGKSTTKSPKK